MNTLKCPTCWESNTKDDWHKGTIQHPDMSLTISIDEILNRFNFSEIGGNYTQTFACPNCLEKITISSKEIKEIFGHTDKFIKEY